MDYDDWDMEDARGKLREMIAEKCGAGSKDLIEIGTHSGTSTCGEGTCWNEWEDFVIRVDNRVVYESNITGEDNMGPFRALQEWLEAK